MFSEVFYYVTTLITSWHQKYLLKMVLYIYWRYKTTNLSNLLSGVAINIDSKFSNLLTAEAQTDNSAKSVTLLRQKRNQRDTEGLLIPLHRTQNLYICLLQDLHSSLFFPAFWVNRNVAVFHDLDTVGTCLCLNEMSCFGTTGSLSFQLYPYRSCIKQGMRSGKSTL